jgi:4a-hydroxytetrahydrobiopterin dehydratase
MQTLSLRMSNLDRDTPLVPKAEMPVLLESVPAWSLDAESNKISRSFVAKNFLAALDFFRHVGAVAEEANHHPDLHLTGYRNVEVHSSTASLRCCVQL